MPDDPKKPKPKPPTYLTGATGIGADPRAHSRTGASGLANWIMSTLTGYPVYPEQEAGPVDMLLAAAPVAGKFKSLKALATGEKAADAALDLSHAARMERAAKQGYTIDAYHGSRRPDIGVPENPTFAVSGVERATGGGMNDRGVFFTTDPSMASDFAEFGGRHGDTSLPTGATVYPVKLRTEQPLALTPSQFDRLQEVMGYRRRGEAVPEIKQYWLEDELAKVTGRPFPEGADPITWIQQQGYDAVVMPPRRYGRNMAPGDAEIMVFNPGNIRSPFAKFDPRKLGDPNLLAGLGAGGVLLSQVGQPKPRGPS